MDDVFRTTAMYCQDIIDCRCLTLAFEYFDLSDEEIIELLADTTQWQTEIMGDLFVSKITINQRQVSGKNAFSTAKKLFKQCGWVSLGQASFARSPVINNHKTMGTYLNKLRTSIIPLSTSKDFPNYWECLFANATDPLDVIEGKILQVFNEKNKYELNYYSLPDIQTLFMAVPHEKMRGRFHGRFYIQMSAFCLNNQVRKASEDFATFAIDVSCKYKNVNARVQLQPVGVSAQSPHMRYFGAKMCGDGSHVDSMFTRKEWYQSYYIPGGEWLNVVSPLARINLMHMDETENVKSMIQELSGGGMLIRSQKNITDYDVDEARTMKELLYPALYPGTSVFPLKKLFCAGRGKFMFDIFPRREWEIIPIFSDEVQIIGTDLVFSHKE